MGLGAALVQGGLLARDVQQYDDQQAERGLRMRTIQSGIQRMDDEDAARPGRLELERLRQDIARTEAEYKKRTMPADQAMADTERGMRQSDLTHRAAMQPGAQEAERLQQGASLTVARGAAGMAPGQVQLAQAQQQEQMRTVKEQQLGRMWGLYRAGDTEGFLTALNESSLIAPGRKFAEVKQVTAPGPAGAVPALQFVAADGGPPITVPMAEMQGLETKYGSQLKAVGKSLVRIGPSGGVTPVFTEDLWGPTRDGGVYNRRTGEMTPGTGEGGTGTRSSRTRTSADTGILPDKWLEKFEKDGLPVREATDEKGVPRRDTKGEPVIEVDETSAPLVRDLARINADILARARVQPGEAGEVFGQFARAAKEKDRAKAFAGLDQGGRLVVVADKDGTPVKMLGRIGTASDGSPILFELPTGLERLLMDQELENRFQREGARPWRGVDEADRLRRRAPPRPQAASGSVRRIEANGVNMAEQP